MGCFFLTGLVVDRELVHSLAMFFLFFWGCGGCSSSSSSSSSSSNALVQEMLSNPNKLQEICHLE